MLKKLVLLSLVGLAPLAQAQDGRIIADPMVLDAKTSKVIPNLTGIPTVGGNEANSELIRLELAFMSLITFGEPTSRQIHLAGSKLATDGKNGELRFTSSSHTASACANTGYGGSVGLVAPVSPDYGRLLLQIKSGIYDIYSNDIQIGTIDVKGEDVRVANTDLNYVASKFIERVSKALIEDRPIVKALMNRKIDGKTPAGNTCKIEISDAGLSAQYKEVTLKLKMTALFPEEIVVEKTAGEEISRKKFAATVVAENVLELVSRPCSRDGMPLPPSEEISFNNQKNGSIYSFNGQHFEVNVTHADSKRSCRATISTK